MEFKPSKLFTNPKYAKYLECGEQNEKEEQAEVKSSAPTLEWFLSLDSETQRSIWGQLRYMLKWSGRMSSDGPINYGVHAMDLFDALKEAGADWEEYT